MTAQILALNIFSNEKVEEERELHKEITGARAGSGNTQGKPEQCAGPGSKEALKKTKGWGMLKGHRSRPERALNGQDWIILTNEQKNVVLDYKPNYKYPCSY